MRFLHGWGEFLCSAQTERFDLYPTASLGIVPVISEEKSDEGYPSGL